MSAMPVAPFLSEFGSAAPVIAPRDAGFAPLGRGPAADGATHAVVAAERLEAARASGFASGEAAAEAALEARLAEQHEAHARELAAARLAWATGEAQRLADALASGLRDLEARIADAAARALVPILRAEVGRQAVDALGAELGLLLGRDGGVNLDISGPEDLIEALRAHLADGSAGKAVRVTYRPGGGPDIRIAAGETILETRLGAWAAKIEEALA
jgi:hypothetical protein